MAEAKTWEWVRRDALEDGHTVPIGKDGPARLRIHSGVLSRLNNNTGIFEADAQGNHTAEAVRSKRTGTQISFCLPLQTEVLLWTHVEPCEVTGLLATHRQWLPTPTTHKSPWGFLVKGGILGGIPHRFVY